eukprot:TRINITY_DN28669_c0_g1_i1.p1 TRINITY_DN28669_c0_g1~~TRINITY_DN28669_c0_g1_i1.p1  ORF type:complete len:1533 (+),score=289.35 TRINITY_DN28669_c0_g1_i1:38-4636(+)
MSWVHSKEEWLIDWSEAKCLKQLSFETPDGRSVAAALQLQGAEDPHNVFFSQTIEVGERCLVCRASGLAVDIFDISPSAESLLTWRINLTSPIVQDVGISHVCDTNAASISLFFLTKSAVVHTVQVFLREVPEVLLGSSTVCKLPSTASSFCALGRDMVAIGCFEGTLHAFRLLPGISDPTPQPPIYDFVRRASATVVLDMVSVRQRQGVWSSGHRLLSFSSDGQLRLWEAQERRGKLVASQALLSASEQQAVSLLGTSLSFLRVSPSNVRACLVLRSSVYVIDMSSAMVCSKVQAPFPGATPSLVCLSDSSLWGFWSGVAREQLFLLDLEGKPGDAWTKRALDAAQLTSAYGAAATARAQRLVTQGCDGSQDKTAEVGHAAVFTLYQQHEAWRLEERDCDALRISEALAGSASESLEEVIFQWWLSRIFLAGRFSAGIISAALKEAEGQHAGATATSAEEKEEGLRRRVEEHLRTQAATYEAQPMVDVMDDIRSRAQRATALASASAEFLRICSSIWRRCHQVCGMGVSAAWGPHAWFPVGDVVSEPEGLSSGCLLLLSSGGMSCVRPVHSWPERWWTTLHWCRDCSAFEKVEMKTVMELSPLDEWKFCGTAWFLSQAVSSANLCASLSFSQEGTSKPTQCVESFVDDPPESLASVIAQCLQPLSQTLAAEELSSIREALFPLAGQAPGATVFSHGLQPLSGRWEPPLSTAALCLSDLLRGSTAASESAYLCAVSRDLLLFCMYAQKHLDLQQLGLGQIWSDLQNLLEQQLPLTLDISLGLGLQAPALQTRPDVLSSCLACDDDVVMDAMPGPAGSGLAHLPSRPCDVWAAKFRMASSAQRKCLGLRPAPASFRSVEYALELVCWSRWDALRRWYSHSPSKGVAAYAAGRENLAHQRYALARDFFLRVESQAASIMDALRSSNVETGSMDVDSLTPLAVAFKEHIAGLFRSHGQLQDEYDFLRLAVLAAEEPADGEQRAAESVRQRLWSNVFERAVSLQKWDEAFETLSRIEAFESHLRLLSQRLRSCGRIELMLKLPEPHRTYFLSNLHGSAAMGIPISGSDALSCYQHLYALYFSDREYLKAATVAHSLFASLGSSLRHYASMGGSSFDLPPVLYPDSGQSDRSQTESARRLIAGDCVSKISDVPLPCSGLEGSRRPRAHALLEAAAQEAVNPYASSRGNVWELLEQQRAALLMLISALTMTPEQTVLIVPSSAQMRRVAPLSGPIDMGAVQQWFSQASEASRDLVISAEDARRMLTVVEAQMVLSGREGMCQAAEAAEAVANLGLVRLAVRVAQTCGLDLWQCALRPFVHLCVKAENAPDEVVQALAAAAQESAQAYMFVQSDGAWPLGSGGSVRRAWWQTLEETLREVSGQRPAVKVASQSSSLAVPLDAAATRLYSLVASEVLSLNAASQKRLPDFLVDALSAGPSWVTLLRIYMKHCQLEEAIELLGSQLRLSSQQMKAAGWHSLTALHDFPVLLVVQLLKSVRLKAKQDPSSRCAGKLETLEATVRQFQLLLADFENSAPAVSR